MSSPGVSFWEMHCWAPHALGGLCVHGDFSNKRFGQIGTVSPASYKSSERLMLQATYASVSKEKEEIHCGALAWI